MKDNTGKEITTGSFLKFQEGFMNAIYGTFHFLKSQERALFFAKKAIMATLAVSAVRVIATIALYLVIHTVFLVATLIYMSFEFEFDQIFDFYGDSKQFIMFLVGTVPFFFIDFVSRIYPEPFEAVFYEAMDVFDPYFSKTVQTRKSTQSSYDEVKFLLESSYKRGAVVRLGVILELLPFIGVIIVPIYTFVITYDCYGSFLSGLISLAFFLFSKLDDYAGSYLILCFSIREFVANMMRPYMRRTMMEPSQQVYFFYKNFKLLMGFAVPFYFLSTLPYFGVTFYMVGQAAMGLIIAKYGQAEEVTIYKEKLITEGANKNNTEELVPELKEE